MLRPLSTTSFPKLERSDDHLGLLLIDPLNLPSLKILWDLQNPSVRNQSLERLAFLRFAL